MFKKLAITLALLGPAATSAQNNLTIPWDEFRSLYTERLRYEFELEIEDDTPPAIVSISDATYRLSLAGANATLEVSLKGNVIQGHPEPIRLFERDLAITEVVTMQGGTLIGDERGYRFVTKGEESFQIVLKAVVTMREDQRSRFVAFVIPPALKNVLEVKVSDELEIIDAPGIKQPDGRYYFSPESTLELRFTDAARLEATRDPSIDTFTRITLEGNKYILTTTLVPNQRLPARFRIDIPAPLAFLDTSLRRSFVKQIDPRQIELALPRDWMSPFRLRFEVDAVARLPELSLPKIVANQGREGEFQLIQPVEARLSVDGEQLERRIPAARLSPQIRAAENVKDIYLAIPIDTSMTLSLERFDAVEAPEVVLNAIHFYTSFAENGTAISVLRLMLPATSENRLQLKSIADAEIWSVTVNGEERSLYTREQGNWIVPLPANESAVVELTYIQKQAKLELAGKLPIRVPEIGLAAQHVYVAIALAERVKLVAMESDLVPTDGSHFPPVKAFVGIPYYFEYPFYRGESLSATIYYKEPLTDG